MIFGRKGCNENRNWRVRVYFNDESYIKIADQLAEKEAKEIYEKARNSLKDTKDETFEIEYDGELMTFNKVNVSLIKLEKI